MEPFFAELKAKTTDNEADIFFVGKNVFAFTMTVYLGFDTIGNGDEPGVVMIGDDNLKVINQFEQESFRKARAENLQVWAEDL